MKIPKQFIPFIVLAVILIVLAVSALSLFPGIRPSQPVITTASAEAVSGSGIAQPHTSPPAPTGLLPGSTAFPLPTPFPAVTWSETPPCANQPQAADAAAQSIMASAENAQQDFNLRRAMLLSPKLAQLQTNQVRAMLAENSPAASSQKALLGLAMNLATGRMNRATGISFTGLPDIKTTGDLLDRLEGTLSGAPADPVVVQAAQDVQSGKGITQPVCARLVMTRAGSAPSDLRWIKNGVSAQTIAPQGIVFSQTGQSSPAVDTVTTSPDGRWAAFTSLGTDAGGPVFVLNLASGETTNLIDKANGVQGQNPLASDWWWDVIGWMPDSQRLVIGPADMSAVFIIDISSGKYQVVPLNADGLGGAQFIGLAPDGSQLAYVAMAENGSEQSLNTYTFASGQVSTLIRFPLADGALYYPRFAPDGRFIAYVVQKGQPQTGVTYAIQLYGFEKKLTYIVADGNLGLTVPTWSPDGQYLAFTRKNIDAPDKINPDKPFDLPGVNVWVASMTTGKLQQVTSIDGTARRPVWNSDARTLSFITHDGQVGLVNVDRPGKIWRAAEPSTPPEFTSVFFVP